MPSVHHSAGAHCSCSFQTNSGLSMRAHGPRYHLSYVPCASPDVIYYTHCTRHRQKARQASCRCRGLTTRTNTTSGRTPRRRRASWCVRTTARALTTRGQRSAARYVTRSVGSSETKHQLPLPRRVVLEIAGDDDVDMVATGAPNGDGSEDDDTSTDEEEDDGESLGLFAPLSESDPARFDNISNLRALRLLFDVSARATPGPGQQQLAAGGRGAQHRLSGLRGLQETYDACGRTLWIFDACSRSDGCARLVSEAGDVAT
jgi:hypothetical protein